MSTFNRLNQVYTDSKLVSINDNSRIIIFNDCHRGDFGWADDFAKNQNIFLHALSYYYHDNFTYIELGDGDELWKNRSFVDIFTAHRPVYEMISHFYHEDRFYMLLETTIFNAPSPVM